MEMEFKEADGRKVVLRGMSNDAPRIISAKWMEGIFQHGDVAYAVECLVTTEKPSGSSHQYHVDIQTLLSKYDRVFGKIPPGRPPDRGFKHTIELEEGAKPMITTPYRHPKKFKDEIEKTIKELLEMGHIRPSSSPFTSSVVLVKKKDGTMQMCIDYRALNKKTIKRGTQFPRSMICWMSYMGQCIFRRLIFDRGTTRLESESRTFQKLAFRCHYGHYKFLVMPFGLTNAPTTFQSCMNHIFKKKLRKFLLVFFDDLLIYSKTWEEHLRHLEEILSIMEDQSLYAKESKCEFGMIWILYLGHVVSAQGVQVHRKNIQAILDWPPPKNISHLCGFFGICSYYRQFVKGFS
jgi:hypothetical protein